MGGQSVLYGYCCAFLMKFFEPSAIIFRIPAVCSGMLTWFFGTLTIRELIGKKEAFVGAALLAVCPCFILHSRLGLDCFLFLGASTVSLYIFMQALKASGWKRLLFYTMAGVGFGINLYTYALSWLAVPIFLVLILAYLLYIKKIQWQEILCMGIPLGILALPLITMIVLNTFELPEIVTGYFTIPRLMEYRGAEISLKNMINNVPVLIQSCLFNDDYEYNSIPTYFSLYLVSVPFLVFGIQKAAVQMTKAVREKRMFFPAVVFMWFLAQTFMGLLIKEPNANKLNAVFFVLLFFTVYGMKESCRLIHKKRFKKYFVLGVFLTYSVFFAGFVNYYFTEYTSKTFPLPYFQAGFSDVLDDWEERINGKDVYVDAWYIFYPLGEKMSPMEFQLIEKGTEARDNIHFGLPKELEEDSFYFVFGDERSADRLTEAGYTMERSGMYRVFYKF